MISRGTSTAPAGDAMHCDHMRIHILGHRTRCQTCRYGRTEHSCCAFIPRHSPSSDIIFPWQCHGALPETWQLSLSTLSGGDLGKLSDRFSDRFSPQLPSGTNGSELSAAVSSSTFSKLRPGTPSCIKQYCAASHRSRTNATIEQRVHREPAVEAPPKTCQSQDRSLAQEFLRP